MPVTRPGHKKSRWQRIRPQVYWPPLHKGQRGGAEHTATRGAGAIRTQPRAMSGACLLFPCPENGPGNGRCGI